MVFVLDQTFSSYFSEYIFLRISISKNILAGPGASGFSCSEVYKGSSAFSENESKAIARLAFTPYIFNIHRKPISHNLILEFLLIDRPQISKRPLKLLFKYQATFWFIFCVQNIYFCFILIVQVSIVSSAQVDGIFLAPLLRSAMVDSAKLHKKESRW